MQDFKDKFQRFLELMEVMEQAVVYKLRQKNPMISDDEIKAELAKWYLDRPGAPYGDAEGIVGDVSKYLK